MMKLEELSESVYHIKFDTQYDMTSTFMRLQEFYESPFPNIRNKYFTHEEYMDTCAYDGKRSGDHETTKFTYLQDWGGFNVPGNVFNRWVKVFEDDLWEKEANLINLVWDQLETDTNRFYVIGTSPGDDQAVAIDHELSHAWFYLDRKYKKAMLDLERKLNKTTRKHVEVYLAENGYHESVFKDETQAYLATNQMTDTADMFPEGYKIPWELVADFQQTFAEARKEKLKKEE